MLGRQRDGGRLDLDDGEGAGRLLDLDVAVLALDHVLAGEVGEGVPAERLAQDGIDQQARVGLVDGVGSLLGRDRLELAQALPDAFLGLVLVDRHAHTPDVHANDICDATEKAM